MTNTSKAYTDYVVFVECKSLRGRSKAEYLRQVRKLAEYYPSRSLKALTERQVFDYLIFRRDQQKLRPSTVNQAVVALRMFYRDYLQRDWQLWRQFEIRRDQPLPVVLTREETRRLMRAIRSNRFKAILCLGALGSRRGAISGMNQATNQQGGKDDNHPLIVSDHNAGAPRRQIDMID